jgi:hypothetical protein
MIAISSVLMSRYDVDQQLLLLADVFNTTVEAQLAELQAAGMSMAGGCAYQDVSDAPWFAVEVRWAR